MKIAFKNQSTKIRYTLETWEQLNVNINRELSEKRSNYFLNKRIKGCQKKTEKFLSELIKTFSEKLKLQSDAEYNVLTSGELVSNDERAFGVGRSQLGAWDARNGGGLRD